MCVPLARMSYRCVRLVEKPEHQHREKPEPYRKKYTSAFPRVEQVRGRESPFVLNHMHCNVALVSALRSPVGMYRRPHTVPQAADTQAGWLRNPDRVEPMLVGHTPLLHMSRRAELVVDVSSQRPHSKVV